MAGESKVNRFIVCLLGLLFVAAVGAVSVKTLRQGARGPEVLRIQEWLKILGYFASEPSGFFGRETVRAVSSFQRDNGLRPDGIVGRQTFCLIYKKVNGRLNRVYTVRDEETLERIAQSFNVSLSDLAAYNRIDPESVLRPGQVLRIPPPTLASRNRPAVELVSWDEANAMFPVGTLARVIDVETGLTFRVYRHGGHFHADSEPYAAKDTAIMLAIYNGQWSWSRRAVIVEIGSRRLAASMNGYPHGRDTIKNNNFPGHFCIHFYGSRLHLNGRADPDHQTKIMEALQRFRTN